MAKSLENDASKNDEDYHFLMMNVCKEHDSHQIILVMLTFTIDSTPTSKICYSCRTGHVVGDCPYRPSRVPIFMMELILGTPKLPFQKVHEVFECTPSFTVPTSFLIIQMLSD